jgi:UDP-N-acetyl-D-mannosaminuronate dehydrogenase
MVKQNLVVGLGEIGKPIYNLLSKNSPTLGYDINPNLMPKPLNIKNLKISFLHICIPFSEKFESNVISLFKKFDPEIIVIHSTISPHTTEKIQQKLSIPIIYSATRGVHKRMLYDLKRYTKFFAISKDTPQNKVTSKKFIKLMQKCKVKTRQISNPLTLELAKIVVDTSYYGWLINYAQISNMIARKHNVDYDEMWSFAEEIHRFIGNRPKMYPGFIGGHCVIPNLSLINEESLWQIDKINNLYTQKVKDAKLIKKKYDKSKKISYNF